MNFWQYIIKAWGNKQGYMAVQAMSVQRILGYTLLLIVLISFIHTASLYLHIRHFTQVTVPALAREFPNNAYLLFQKNSLSLVGASTTSFIIRGSKKDILVNIDGTKIVSDTSADMRVPSSISMYRDAIVFTGVHQEEQMAYPDVEIRIDTLSVAAWATKIAQFLPWLVCMVFMFLFVSNIVSALLLGALFLFVIRLYTRFSPPILSYSTACKVAGYTLVPLLCITTFSYIIFGFSSLIITVLVGLLCLHYGLKK